MNAVFLGRPAGSTSCAVTTARAISQGAGTSIFGAHAGRTALALALVRRCLLVFAILGLAPGEQAAGQTQTPSSALTDVPGGAEISPVMTIKTTVDEVDLLFTAMDRNKRWVKDLSETDIRVLDAGHPPERIIKFQRQVDLPLRIGLLIDTSDSISGRFEFEQQAATLFIQRILNPEKDLAFVMRFTESASLIQDFSADTTALSDAIQQLQLGGGTALYDAVVLACEKLGEHSDAQPLRRVLIVLTDGQDNRSRYRVEDAIDVALQTNVIIIALNTAGYGFFSQPANELLKKLADVSGGHMLAADREKQIAKAFNEVDEELRSHYLLAYKPANLPHDGAYRKIQLKANKRGLRMHYRHGYFARAQ
jgi:Ca-activated chloride channel homolog